MTFLALTNADTMFVVGLVLLTVITLRLTLRRFKRDSSRKDEALATRSILSQSNSAGEPPTDHLQWQVEMHETARDLKAELDSKMLALQHLVRLASEEKARLDESIRRARQL